ncbi:MAG: hypothetical protein EXS64_02630 [Candidatus Latescibacteria bacterium]|nr:hypothetical protein [Candidatus Latescibacterota bacterium]
MTMNHRDISPVSEEAHGEVYVLRVPQGFEEIAIRHIAAMPGASEVELLTDGAVELRYTGPLARLRALRVVEGVFRTLGVFLSSRSLDEMMRNLLSQVDFRGWGGGVHDRDPGGRFSLSLSLDPALGIPERDFRSEVTWALQATLRAKPSPEGVAIHVAAGPEAGWVGVGGPERQPSEKGSLPSSVAAGTVLYAGARSDDRVLDPLCGPGELLVEQALAGPVTTLLGGDVDLKAVRSIQARLRGLAAPACACRWDPRRLPIRPRSIDTVIAYLPSGLQAGSRQIARSLYQSLLKEVIRVLRPTGRAVLLAGEKEILTPLLGRQTELAIETQHPVRTGPFRAELYVIRPVLKLLT